MKNFSVIYLVEYNVGTETGHKTDFYILFIQV